MEELYNKIVDHIVLKLKNGELGLSKKDIVKELDISIEAFSEIASNYSLPNFLIGLSKDAQALERIKRITNDLDEIKSKTIGKDLAVTRERISQIETIAMKLIEKSNRNVPDDVA